MHYPIYQNKQISIPYLLKIGQGKLDKLGKYLFDKDMFKIGAFFGEGIENILGERVYESLRKNKIQIVHKQDVTSIAIEDIIKTAFALPALDAIVGVGGGKALDFAKFTAHLLKLPSISVPTSISNDGFCSPSASLTVDGARKSVKASIPFGVVIDLDVIKDSPDEALYAGFGDMISKITALWDWKEATKNGLAHYNDFASLMAYNSLNLLFCKQITDIHSKDFQNGLANSLLISGIAMEIAGTSRPASGAEHLISHALDKVAKKHLPHGIQVGVATLLCALLQENINLAMIKEGLRETGFADFVGRNPVLKTDLIRALKLAPTIKQNYYTILSEDSAFDRAVSFAEQDEMLKVLIK